MNFLVAMVCGSLGSLLTIFLIAAANHLTGFAMPMMQFLSCVYVGIFIGGMVGLITREEL